MKHPISPLSACLALAALTLSGCTATEQDCAALGDKFVELFMQQSLTEDDPFGEELLQSAADAGGQQLVEQCKAKPPLTISIDCALAAESMADLESC